jgi:glycosyltransferase involved in cell wall biosynthesis
VQVCLITTAQPSGNPRLVKEADALSGAGFSVRVVGAFHSDWARAFDRTLVASRQWSTEIFDWNRVTSPGAYWKTRVRYYGARRLASFAAVRPFIRTSSLSRVGPDIRRLAFEHPADLYIAHNLGALPVALAAGERHGALVGFDAEDFHSGQLSPARERLEYEMTREAELALVPRCSYVTAASPGIAEAYRALCDIPLPTCVLNVFPKALRPPAPHLESTDAPIRLHWFSQTIGTNRGLEHLVRALGAIHDRTIQLHLRGRWQEGYEHHLRTLARDVGLRDEQLVAHPPAHPDELVRICSTYDIGLALEPQASLNNDIALSNKLFTYLLAGNAVVATATTGQAAIAPSLGNAVSLCSAASDESLAAAVRPWVEDRALLASARREAWRLGESRYNWEIEQDTFLGVVRNALSSRPSMMSAL